MKLLARKEIDLRRVFHNGKDYVYCIFAALITSVLVYLVLGNRTLNAGPDQVFIMAPLFFDAARSMANGGLLNSMYTEGILAGLSHWGDPNFNPLYPLYFNWSGADGTIYDTWIRLEFISRLHLCILAGGVALLARSLRVPGFLAVIVGVIIIWFPAVQSAAGWPQIISSMSWLPWILASLINIERVPRIWSVDVLILSVSSIFLVLAQPAQNLVFAIAASSVITILVFVYSVIRRRNGILKGTIRTVLAFSVAVGLILLFIGWNILEVLSFHRNSIRWIGDNAHIIGSERLPATALLEHSLPFEGLSGIIVPDSKYTFVVGNPYLSSILLLGCIYGFFAIRDKFLRIAVLAGMFFLSLGFGFMNIAAANLPLINQIREVVWWSSLAILLLVPTGALGLLRMATDARNSANIRRRILWLAIFFGMSASVLWIYKPYSWTLFAAILISGVFVILSNYYGFIGRSRYLKACVSASVVSVLFTVVFVGRAPSASSGMIFNESFVGLDSCARKVSEQLTGGEWFRVAVSTDYPQYKQLTQLLMVHGLNAIRGEVHPQNYPKFKSLFFPDPFVSRLYGVRYVITGASDCVSSSSLVEVEELVGAFPQVYFSRQTIEFADDISEKLQGPNVLENVLIGSGDKHKVQDLVGQMDKTGIDAVQIIAEKSNGAMIVQFVAEGEGLLILNEDPSARWSALVNGRSVAAMSVNGFQTAFPIRQQGIVTVQISRP